MSNDTSYLIYVKIYVCVTSLKQIKYLEPPYTFCIHSVHSSINQQEDLCSKNANSANAAAVSPSGE